MTMKKKTSFNEAFRNSWDKGEDTFDWNGKKYATKKKGGAMAPRKAKPSTPRVGESKEMEYKPTIKKSAPPKPYRRTKISMPSESKESQESTRASKWKRPTREEAKKRLYAEDPMPGDGYIKDARNLGGSLNPRKRGGALMGPRKDIEYRGQDERD
jgi:hypothetical protein